MILIDPRQFNEDPMYISVFSKRQLFYSGQEFTTQTGIDSSYRQQEVRDFFDSVNTELPLQSNLKYVYISKEGAYPKILSSAPNLFEKVFENNSALILKFKPV